MAIGTILPVVGAGVVSLDLMRCGEGRISIELTTVAAAAACPGCGQRSERVHSRYRRTLADLPWQGVPVELRLRSRRFFCDTLDCPRRVFTERLPELVAPYARRTLRLAGALELVAMALGGEAGARVAAPLAMATSPDTLLNLIRRAAGAAAPTPRVLGVDDWALRRGHRYGSILVDLERRCVVDLLADRTAGTLADWLRLRPGIEVIARDRAGAYAEGARQGAPQAVQVADRWHLLRNLGEVLERFLARHHAALREAARATPESVAPAAEAETGARTGRPTERVREAATPRTGAQRESAHRRERRLARYSEVVALHGQGASLRALSERVGISRMTARKYLRAGSFPELATRETALGADTPHGAYLRERWSQGCANAAQLFRELHARGFEGSAGAVRRLVGSWRETPARRGRPSRHRAPTAGQRTPPARPPSPRQVLWLLLRADGERDAAQRAFVERLRASCPELTAAESLAREFRRLVRTRDAPSLAPWLDSAQKGNLPEFREFAAGLRRDGAAVAAALTMAWSNGQAEGQITKLKMLKRQMFGRANLDLLRQRVLLAA
jgi:transposase